MHLIASIDLGC